MKSQRNEVIDIGKNSNSEEAIFGTRLKSQINSDRKVKKDKKDILSRRCQPKDANSDPFFLEWQKPTQKIAESEQGEKQQDNDTPKPTKLSIFTKDEREEKGRRIDISMKKQPKKTKKRFPYKGLMKK